MSQKAFYFNADDCVGCKTCAAACKDINDLPSGVGIKYRKVYEYGGGSWTKDREGFDTPNIFLYFVSASCNHCAEPACLAVCPVAAIEKRADGVVFLDSSKCTACGECVSACPYQVPVLRPDTGKAGKCNFCTDAGREQLNGEPACVSACLNRALKYGELSELQEKAGTTQRDLPPLADSNITGPSIVIVPNKTNVPAKEGDGKIMNPLEV
jgi:anaerobic dimethyl sulfoxide reductase subunit B (iron-sulfur subunit)